MKYVLTGAPCTGKTTIVNDFKKNGYQTVPEVASIFIEEELRKSNEPIWKTDIISFQKKLICKQMEFEAKIDFFKPTFLDRSIIDIIAYCKVFNTNPDSYFIDLAKTNRYSKVFILDFLENYEITNVRSESLEKSKNIQAILIETYKEFGYELIKIPANSISNRVDLILSQAFNRYSKEQNKKNYI